jgi:hypothetical protein
MKIYSVRENLTRGKCNLGGLMIELKVVKGDLKESCATWMSSRKRVVNTKWAMVNALPSDQGSSMTISIIHIVLDIWCHGSLVVGSIWWYAQFYSWFNWLKGSIVVGSIDWKVQ